MIQDTITPTVSQLIVREVYARWFTLPPQFIPLAEKYYLLHWSGSYLAQKIKEDSPDPYSPNIEHQGFQYLVLGMPYFDPTKQYALSFRKLPDQAKGYVLIKSLGN
jgi:hypothetical protein